MKTTISAATLLAMGAVVLTGCQAIGGSRFARHSGPVPQERSAEDYAADQLRLGREALGLREWGLALISFRLVRHMPEHAAEASNGMAIAYANVGRPDLAERLFRQAVELAPGDGRYQANLKQFYTATPEFAVKVDRGATGFAATAQVEPAIPAPRTIMPRSGGAVIRIVLPTPSMVRLSAGEVHLGSPASGGSGQARVMPRSAMVSASGVRRVNPQFRRVAEPPPPIVAAAQSRVAVGPAAPYPVRITIGSR